MDLEGHLDLGRPSFGFLLPLVELNIHYENLAMKAASETRRFKIAYISDVLGDLESLFHVVRSFSAIMWTLWPSPNSSSR